MLSFRTARRLVKSRRLRKSLCVLASPMAIGALPRSALADSEWVGKVPSLHVGAGTSIAVGGPPPNPEDPRRFSLRGEPRLAMDLRFSVPVIGPNGGATAEQKEPLNVLFLPEVGYAYQRHERNLFQVGLGVGVGSYWRGFAAYSPRFIVGKDYTDLALGVRHGLAARLFRESLIVEVAHQATHVRGAWNHDILLMFNVSDPVNLAGNWLSYMMDGW